MSKVRMMFSVIVTTLIMAGVGVGYIVEAQDEIATPTAELTQIVIAPPVATDAPVVTAEPTPAPEQPPAEQSNGISKEVLFLVVVVIASLLLVVVMQNLTIRTQAVKLAVSAPEWAWQTIKAGESSGLATLDKEAKKTPETLDDMGVDRIRKIVEEFNKEVDAARIEQMKAAVGSAVTQALNNHAASVG